MRKLAIVSVAAVLAIASGAQALGNALATPSPQLAASMSPYTAKAEERLATTLITADLETQALDVSAAAPHAAAAVENHLLATEALGVLALAQEDASRRSAMVAAGLGASRRGRILNAAAMASSIDQGDADALLAALNRALLLYPSQKDATIPLLVGQLGDPRLVPGFVGLLSSAPDWAEDFWVEAARHDDYAANLAAIRLGLPAETPMAREPDRALLRLLARTRRFDDAATLFARIKGADEVPVVLGDLGWSTEYMPFDWQFFDQSGRFARPSSDGSSLTVMVRPGYGGLLARRLLRLDGMTFLEVNHSLDPAAANRVQLVLECPDSDPAWSDTLGPSPTGMRIAGDLPCEYAWLRIEARASVGSPEISGQILGIIAR